jgi:multiple sugar transport system ATP-binding protein
VLVEPTGSETHVLMRLHDQNLTGVFRERLRATRGDRIRLAIDANAVHLFDRETQRRI